MINGSKGAVQEADVPFSQGQVEEADGPSILLRKNE